MLCLETQYVLPTVAPKMMVGARSGRKCKDGIRVQKWMPCERKDGIIQRKGEDYQGTD
jgi:hypothetical protein